MSELGNALLVGAVLALSASAVVSAPLEKGAVVEAAPPAAPVDFEIYLPLRDKAGLESLLQAQVMPGAAQYHSWLTPPQFAARFGPTAASMARAQAAARAAGLTVTAAHSRSFHVAGDAAHVGALLHASLNKMTSPGGSTRMVASVGPVLSGAMQQEGARIVALNSLPNRQLASIRIPANPANRYTARGSYWFDDLKQAYDYPAYGAPMKPHSGRDNRPGGLDGTGVNVAILISDLIYPGDIAAAFNHEHFTEVTGKPVPRVTTVTVDGGGVVGGPGSGEASLDAQQVLGGAPGANVTIVSIPDLSDQSLSDGYTYIVDSNKYDLVNSSFGECELYFTAAYNNGTDLTYILQIEHEIFQQGNAQGITFVAASGDEGGLECTSTDYGSPGASPTFVPGVSTPADDPAVTAVGGGNLITTATAGSLDSSYVRESAFGDPEMAYDIFGVGQNVSGGYWGAGGGPSSVFRRPWYQSLVDTGSRFRTVPDVGMQVGGMGFSGLDGSDPGFCSSFAISCSADGSSVLAAIGFNYGGGFYYNIGTSISSPEFVGALALFSQSIHSRLGNVNYYLYLAALGQTFSGGANAPPERRYFHRNIPGFDGVWKGNYPNVNYNYIYGNGSPDVRKLFGLDYYPPAGPPRTPGNP